MNQLRDFRSDTSRATVREARVEDSALIAQLLEVLGYPSSSEHVEERLAKIAQSDGDAVFVAEAESKVVGVLSFHCILLFHVAGNLGRITSLVVASSHRQQGVGLALVRAAEEFARAQGCLRIEVTSGDHRADAHAFYEQVGYQLECRRFIKHASAPEERSESHF